MTPEQLIKKVECEASEWLEMTDQPAAMVAGILAKQVISLMEYIEFLEKVRK